MESNSYSPEHTEYYRVKANFDRFMQNYKHDYSSLSNPPLTNIPISLTNEELDTADVNYTPKQKKMKTDFNSLVKIKKMELAHSSAKKAHVKANIELERQCAELKSENLALTEKYENLELKCSEVTRQSLQLVDELEGLRKARNDGVSKWENCYLKLLDQMKETEEKNQLKMSELSQSVSELKSQNMVLTSHLSIANLDIAEANEQLEIYKPKAALVNELTIENETLSVDICKYKHEINDLKMRLENAEEAENMMTIFKEDLNSLRCLKLAHQKLTKENEILKQGKENCLLLKEQLLSAEEKLERASKQVSRVPQLEMDLEALQSKIKTFEVRTHDENEIQILKSQLHDLKENVIKPLESKNSDLENDIKSNLHKENDNKKFRNDLQIKIDRQNETIISLNDQLFRQRRKALLSTNERDSLRSILATYDSELTFDTQSSLILKRLQVAEESNAALQSQCKSLEEELEKQSKNSQSTKHLSSQVTEENLKASEELKVANKVIEKLRSEISNSEETVEKLENIIELGKMKGLYDPQSSKVLHFTLNPAALAHQKSKHDAQEMKIENSRLKTKIAQLQTGLNVSIVETEQSKEAIQKLQTSELQNKRLKEAFSKKIQEFRRIYYLITGFTISSVSDTKYKVVSTYAENGDDFLLFELKSNGQVDLLETEYSSTLNELMELHLVHQNSLPMFLCAVTTNLFSQQTIMTD